MKKPIELPQATWSASGESSIKLERLPQFVDGLPAHIVALDLELNVTIDDDASNATPGEDMVRMMSSILITDRLGNKVVDLKGHELRTYLRAITGIKPVDPADIPAGTAGNVSRQFTFRIPFHGGENGVIGLRKYEDYWQPCDRFRNGHNIEVQWGSAEPFSAASTGVIQSGTLDITAHVVPSAKVIQGVDLRHAHGTFPQGESTELTLKGIQVLYWVITNLGLDHSAYTGITIDKLQLMTNISFKTLCKMWNAAAANSTDDYLSLTAPEMLPLVFQGRHESIINALGFGEGKLEVQHADPGETPYFVSGQLYNNELLTNQLRTIPQTVYAAAGSEVKVRFANMLSQLTENRAAIMRALMPREISGRAA